MKHFNLRYILVGVSLTLFLVGGILYIREIHPAPKTLPAALGGTHNVKGRTYAPIQMIEYSDFQCPACQKAEGVISKIMAEYPGKIEFTYKHFPLAGHQWSRFAHQAAECAASKGKFWEYHDRLYAEQNKWAYAKEPMVLFLEYAKAFGLDLNFFAACMTDEKIKTMIQEDKKQGEALQVKSTPTFFVNGQRFVGHVELDSKGRVLINQTLGIKMPAPPPVVGMSKLERPKLPPIPGAPGTPTTISTATTTSVITQTSNSAQATASTAS